MFRSLEHLDFWQANLGLWRVSFDLNSPPTICRGTSRGNTRKATFIHGDRESFPSCLGHQFFPVLGCGACSGGHEAAREFAPGFEMVSLRIFSHRFLRVMPRAAAVSLMRQWCTVSACMM